MSFLFKDAVKKSSSTEEKQKFHISSSSGIINDISGICRFNGRLHIYFIYSPQSGIEKKSICGHFTSEGFTKYSENPPIILPDSVFDQSGILSGSVLCNKDGITLFYTGLVKTDEISNEGNFEKNIVKVFLKDGFTAEKKEVLLKNEEALKNEAEFLSHPKVWEGDKGYFLMLGGSIKNNGCAVIYFSADLEKWKQYRIITSAENMGCLWEYPDAFLLDNKPFLLALVKSENAVTSGFCTLTETETFGFSALDFGTDFYSPHSFEDDNKRRILLGVIRSLKGEKTHSFFSIPRMLTLKKGRIYQEPITELKELRENRRTVSLERGEKCDTFKGAVFEAILRFAEEDYSVFIRDDILISCENKTMTVALGKEDGKRIRKSFFVENPKTVRIFSDVFSIEVFADGKSFTAYVDDSKEGGIYVAQGSVRGEIYKLFPIKRA